VPEFLKHIEHVNDEDAVFLNFRVAQTNLDHTFAVAREALRQEANLPVASPAPFSLHQARVMQGRKEGWRSQAFSKQKL
jgi:hypothetical protein